MSQDEKCSETKATERTDLPTLFISRNSSIATDDSISHPRLMRGSNTDGDRGIHRALSDDRGFQSNIHFHLKDSASSQNLPDYGGNQSPAKRRQREQFRSMPTEDMSEYACSDNISVASDRSNAAQLQSRSPPKSPKVIGSPAPTTINYHGVSISQAASQGNLPLCVLLWGMATAKRVKLMDPDQQGDTPMHFAAMADLPEVMSFLHQQTRMKNDPQNRLVGLRNNKGETPLHRACCVGKVPSLKFLLDSNSDPFALDNEGNSIFINLTRYGCIWGLHYVHSYLCGKYGPDQVHELLYHEDYEGHNAMHWAAFVGNVNIIEYLIRRNLDPLKRDRMNRSCLHIAAVCGHVNAFVFLAKCGCNPALPDQLGETPLSIAKAAGFLDITAAARGLRRRRKVRTAPHAAQHYEKSADCPPISNNLVGIDGSSFGCSGDLDTDIESGESVPKRLVKRSFNRGLSYLTRNNEMQDCRTGHEGNVITLYETPSNGTHIPHAMRRLQQSRISYALLYAAVVVGCWLLALAIPFYAWLILAALSFFTFRYCCEYAQQQQDAALKPATDKLNASRKWLQDTLLAPERYLGLYIGMMTVCVLFWLCSLHVGMVGNYEPFGPSQGMESSYSRSLKPQSVLSLSRSAEFLTIGALSMSTDDFNLFVASVVLLSCSSLIWTYLVWIGTDPGAVHSRTEDFDMIMDQSLIAMGAPSDRLFCSTSFVRKPTRSKYCALTGFVIARMDHHCVWLNNSVGFGNHRVFMLFLVAQLGATAVFAVMISRALIREIGLNSTACGAVSYMLDRHYFFPTTLCVVLCAITLILAALLLEQSVNVARNITANERINRSRYPWMNNEQGLPFNHYDRGFYRNVLEFWHIPGYRIDYFSEFDMQPNKVGSDKGLVAQESLGLTGTSIDCPTVSPPIGRGRSEKSSATLSNSGNDETDNLHTARCRSPVGGRTAPVLPLPLPVPDTISYADSPMTLESPRIAPPMAPPTHSQPVKKIIKIVRRAPDIVKTDEASVTYSKTGVAPNTPDPTQLDPTSHVPETHASYPCFPHSIPITPSSCHGTKRARRES